MIESVAMDFVESGFSHPVKELTLNRLMGRINIEPHIGRWEGDFREKMRSTKIIWKGNEEGEGGL